MDNHSLPVSLEQFTTERMAITRCHDAYLDASTSEGWQPRDDSLCRPAVLKPMIFAAGTVASEHDYSCRYEPWSKHACDFTKPLST